MQTLLLSSFILPSSEAIILPALATVFERRKAKEKVLRELGENSLMNLARRCRRRFIDFRHTEDGRGAQAQEEPSVLECAYECWAI
jgi:hypothetical protein